MPKFSKTVPSAPIFGPFGPENGQASPAPETSDGKCEGGRKVAREPLSVSQTPVIPCKSIPDPHLNGNSLIVLYNQLVNFIVLSYANYFKLCFKASYTPLRKILGKPPQPPEPEKITGYLVLCAQKRQKIGGQKNLPPQNPFSGRLTRGIRQ